MKKYLLLWAFVFCLAFAGCGQEEEPDSSDPGEEEAAEFSMVPIPVLEEVLFDLDGDGAEDSVQYAILDDEGMSFNLSANGIGIDQDGCYVAETAYIVDLDDADPYKEIAVSEYGPSDDLMVHFLRFNGSEWTVVGYIPGFVTADENAASTTTTLYGDGTLDTQRRGEVVCTWFFTARYQMEEDALIWQEADAYEMSIPVTLGVDLALTAIPGGSEVVATLPQGTETEIKETDNFSWVSFQLEDGSIGYASLGEDGFSLVDPPLPTYEVFEGLNFAD